MNCLIILLLLACGGCQNGCGCNGTANSGSERCRRQDSRESNEDCSCGENRRAARHQRLSEREDCECEQGEPAAWREGREGREGRQGNYPSLSGEESCGCNAE